MGCPSFAFKREICNLKIVSDKTAKKLAVLAVMGCLRFAFKREILTFLKFFDCTIFEEKMKEKFLKISFQGPKNFGRFSGYDSKVAQKF